MLNSITDFFSQYLGGETGRETTREHALELCAAVLMLEIALADSDMDDEERAVIEKAINYHFHLDEEETSSLMELAHNEVKLAVSLHDFTRIVNNSLSRDEKTTVIELLWRVAVADNVIDKYEEYFIRKISDLLYVSHADYIRAKHRAVL
jgi:uncharacterized tellurite resistance protein B-like protein